MLAVKKKFEEKPISGEKVTIESFANNTLFANKGVMLKISLIDTNKKQTQYEIEAPLPEPTWDNSWTPQQQAEEKYIPLKIRKDGQTPSVQDRAILLDKLKQLPNTKQSQLLKRVMGLLEQCRFVEPY
jgi:hypothetical protein